MKCESYVLWGKKTKRSKHITPVKILTWWHTTDKGIACEGVNGNFSEAELLAQGFTLCGGTIKVKIDAAEEPDYYDSSSAVLNIEYVCDVCGNTCFPHLPKDADSLSAFVEHAVRTRAAQPMMAEERQKTLDARRQASENATRMATSFARAFGVKKRANKRARA